MQASWVMARLPKPSTGLRTYLQCRDLFKQLLENSWRQTRLQDASPLSSPVRLATAIAGIKSGADIQCMIIATCTTASPVRVGPALPVTPHHPALCGSCLHNVAFARCQLDTRQDRVWNAQSTSSFSTTKSSALGRRAYQNNESHLMR